MRDSNKIRLAKLAAIVLPRAPAWFTDWVAVRLFRWFQRNVVSRREPDFCVVRDSDKDVYLKRWWIVCEDFARASKRWAMSKAIM